MTKRVERIVAETMGRDASIVADALTWAGTFHGVGARLLREYAHDIGLDQSFSIHDREDSADLMNLVRHELGFSRTEGRFPAKGTCLAIYSRAVNAQTKLDEVLGDAFPWCAGWPAFVEAFSSLRRSGRWPADIERVRLWYEPHLERMHEDAPVRRADLLQLEQIATTYSTRERFLTELTLDPPESTSDQAGPPHLDEDYLILSTIHSAKGQEWTKVFVLNTVDGCIPIDLRAGSEDEIEEERRLLYVAMTRAKDSLHLVTPQRFFVSGQAARRPAYVCLKDTLYPGKHPHPLPADGMAESRRGNIERACLAQQGRPWHQDARHVEVEAPTGWGVHD